MASKSVNKVILLGHLGKDAETKFTTSGAARTSFSLATNRRMKDQQTGEWKDITDWHNIVLWKSENLANYLTKGTRVYIEGRLESRSYEDKEGQKKYITEVVAYSEDVVLLGGRGEGAPGEHPQPQPVSMPRSAPRPQAAAGPPEDFNQAISDDDVPF